MNGNVLVTDPVNRNRNRAVHLIEDARFMGSQRYDNLLTQKISTGEIAVIYDANNVLENIRVLFQGSWENATDFLTKYFADAENKTFTADSRK